jgi:S-adenosylmethionine hydrolase
MKHLLFILYAITLFACGKKQNPAIVLQTDFGQKDGAVAAMKGIITGVNAQLRIHDLTHDIPAYNTWEAAYRLAQTAPYWPAGTVFVSVVDPGVGTQRKSLALKTKTGHYFISPDNGTLTLIAEQLGIAVVRSVDEATQRRPGSGGSYTFLGRDLYAYAAARLAAGKVEFVSLGPVLTIPMQTITYQKAVREHTVFKGNIPVLDVQYGNVWTDIPDTLLLNNGFRYGDTLTVQLKHKDSVVLVQRVPLCKTFGEVPEGKPLAYFNSLMNVSLALNMGNYAAVNHIKSGPDWSIVVGR